MEKQNAKTMPELMNSNYAHNNYTLQRNTWRKEAFAKVDKKTLEFFTKFISKRIDKAIQNRFLLSIERGDVGCEGFITFVIQHYFSADWFMQLLSKGIIEMNLLGYIDVANEFKQNQDDEMGVVEGVEYLENSHESWRQDYCKALKIDLSVEVAWETTMALHRDPLKDAISKEGGFFLCGMLIATEYYLAKEFKKIQKGRDLLFPEIFVIKPNDTGEVMQQKELARKYLDAHIEHDVFHFLDLLGVTLLAVDTEKEKGNLVPWNDVVRGIVSVAQAKASFYRGLEKKLL